MQAYQSDPCPYCGAIWNAPGAPFCVKCHLQLPPPQPAYQTPPAQPTEDPTGPVSPTITEAVATIDHIALESKATQWPRNWIAANQKLAFLGGALVTVLGSFGALVAMGQLAADAEAQTLRAVVAHQSSVAAAMTGFLMPSTASQADSTSAIRAESDRNLKQYRDALAAVRADEASLRQARSTLASLGPLAFGNSSTSALGHRTDIGVAGLGQAEQVLTAAMDQETLLRGVFEAWLKENDMLAALEQHQYSQADRIDAYADHDLLPADWRLRGSDIPPQMRHLAGSMREIIDATDGWAIFTFRNQPADAQRAQDRLTSAISTFTQSSSDAAIAENDDWNKRTYGPEVIAYDAALSQIRGS